MPIRTRTSAAIPRASRRPIIEKRIDRVTSPARFAGEASWMIDAAPCGWLATAFCLSWSNSAWVIVPSASSAFAFVICSAGSLFATDWTYLPASTSP